MSDRNTCRLPSCENEPRGREPDVNERDRRALTEYLTVLEDLGRARDADGLYLVVSQSGSEYLVDAREGHCECPDHEYRGGRCKHLRRVEFAIGECPVPEGVDREAIDEDLGQHVDGGPRLPATDGGVPVTDARPVELTLTFEPPVTAEDLRDRFQELADRMAEAAEGADR